jgi:hypothetical protein
LRIGYSPLLQQSLLAGNKPTTEGIKIDRRTLDVGDGDLALMGAPNAGGKLTAKPLRVSDVFKVG